MLLMMIVVMAVKTRSGNGPMEMMMDHHNPAHTEVFSFVQIHSGGADMTMRPQKPNEFATT